MTPADLDRLLLELRDLRTDLLARLAESEKLREEAVADCDTLFDAINRTAYDCGLGKAPPWNMDGMIAALVEIALKREADRAEACKQERAKVVAWLRVVGSSPSIDSVLVRWSLHLADQISQGAHE